MTLKVRDRLPASLDLTSAAFLGFRCIDGGLSLLWRSGLALLNH